MSSYCQGKTPYIRDGHPTLTRNPYHGYTVYTPLLLGPDEHLLTQGILGVRCLDPSTYSLDFCIPTKNKLVKI